MRPDTSDPIQGAAEATHTTIFRGPHPIAFNPRTDLEAIGQLVRSLYLTGELARVGGRKLQLLMSLAALCNGKHFRATGEMVCWPGEVVLADGIGLKRSGSVYPILRALARLDLVERVTVEVDGKSRTVQRLKLPELCSAGTIRSRDRVRDRRGMRARSQRARAPKTGARSQRARARAHGERAPKSHSYRVLNSVDETPKSSSSSTSPPVEAPQEGLTSAAAAAVRVELEELGIEEAAIVALLELATTTRENVLAWSIESKQARLTRTTPTGFVIAKLRAQAAPPAKALRQARAKLNRPIARPAASPGDDRPTTDPAVGAAQLKAALEKARAEEPTTALVSQRPQKVNVKPARPIGDEKLWLRPGGVK